MSAKQHSGDCSAALLRDFSFPAVQFHFVLTDSFYFVVFFSFFISHPSSQTYLHITGRVNKQPWWWEWWDVLQSVRQQSSTVYPWVFPHEDNAPAESRTCCFIVVSWSLVLLKGHLWSIKRESYSWYNPLMKSIVSVLENRKLTSCKVEFENRMF